jgi:hypothetical protein
MGASPSFATAIIRNKKSAAAMSTEPESALSAIVLQNIEIARRSCCGLLARRVDRAQRIINVNN